MKKIIVVLLVIGAVIAAAPFVTGYFAEGENRRIMEAVNLDKAANGQIDIVSYDRGYMSAKVEYEYHFPLQMQTVFPSDEPVKLSCDYEHGFGRVNYACSMLKNEFYTSFLQDYLDGNDPLSITGSASAFGAMEQVISLDALSGTVPEGGTFSLQASRLVLQTDKALTKFDVNGAIGDVEMVDSKGTFIIKGGKITGSVESIGHGLYTGDTTMVVDSMSLKSPISDMTLESLEFRSDVQEVGENLDMRMDYSLGSFISAEGALPNAEGSLPNAEASLPGAESSLTLNISDAEISMQMLGMDTNAMIAYQDWVRDMQAAMTDVDGNVDALAMPDAMGITQIMDMAFKKDLQLNLRGAAKVNGGANSLNLSVKLLESMTAQELQSIMVDPDSAFKSIELDLDAQLDKAMVESTPNGAIVSQNPLFRPNDKGYAIALKLGPTSSLNGEATNASQLMGMLMPQAQMQPAELPLD